jgi:hypothetical protein
VDASEIKASVTTRKRGNTVTDTDDDKTFNLKDKIGEEDLNEFINQMKEKIDLMSLEMQDPGRHAAISPRNPKVENRSSPRRLTSSGINDAVSFVRTGHVKKQTSERLQGGVWRRLLLFVF